MPEACDLVELGHGTSGGAERTFQRGFFLDEFGVLCFHGLLFLDALTVQNGQAKLQVADLAIIALTLLLQKGIFGTDCCELLGLSQLGSGLSSSCCCRGLHGVYPRETVGLRGEFFIGCLQKRERVRTTFIAQRRMIRLTKSPKKVRPQWLGPILEIFSSLSPLA